jgi:hypothetical protein
VVRDADAAEIRVARLEAAAAADDHHERHDAGGAEHKGR